ncbi:MAG: hypothetical protein ABSG03_15405 [Bryobacteraceae bacterium]
MATIKRLPAKRGKAQKTTIPSTAERTATAPFNTSKHGVHNKTQIISEESAEGLALLSAEYHEQYLPANPVEHALVETLIKCEWTLRRLRRTEVEIWEQVSDKILADRGPDGVVTAGETFAAGSDQFLRFQRVVESYERNYHRAHKELQRLRAAMPQSGSASGRRGSILQFPQPPRRTEPPSE